MPWVWRSRSVQSSAWMSAERKSESMFTTRRVLSSLREMRLMMGVLLSLLHDALARGGVSGPSAYKAVRDIWKRREAFGRTGNTAESSARKACMKASVMVMATRETRQGQMRCMLRGGVSGRGLLTLSKKNSLYTCCFANTFEGMQFEEDETPPGPVAYVDSQMFGSNLYEPLGYRWSERSRLDLLLQSLPPSELQAVRTRNGLSPNGPWEEVYVVSSDDMEADIEDFEKYLKTLVTMEYPDEEDEGRVLRVPRVTHIRDMISECLEPIHHRTPEVFDMRRMAFYDSDERAFLKERITGLLGALYACQTLSMDSLKLRAYLDSERKTAYQIERTRIFVGMVERYKHIREKNALVTEVEREEEGMR